ncbi:hypothetical protein SESBI_32866 [Sesbania bispinosa]|nr:hypothetical protein SESBI_32866 [Sesbania bispinosa]
MANSHRPAVAIHKAQTISKTKRKIRIIHILAPQIIKTDTENFRELVQRITGKPSGEKCCKQKNPTIAPGNEGGIDQESSSFWGLDQSREKKVKEELGFCSDGSYLGGFSDLEGFISELGEFPMLPLDMDGTQV